MFHLDAFFYEACFDSCHFFPLVVLQNKYIVSGSDNEIVEEQKKDIN